MDERLHIVVEHLRRLAGEVLPAERVVGVGVGVDGGIGARGVALDVVHRAASILQQLGTDDLSVDSCSVVPRLPPFSSILVTGKFRASASSVEPPTASTV